MHVFALEIRHGILSSGDGRRVLDAHYLCFYLVHEERNIICVSSRLVRVATCLRTMLSMDRISRGEVKARP